MNKADKERFWIQFQAVVSWCYGVRTDLFRIVNMRVSMDNSAVNVNMRVDGAAAEDLPQRLPSQKQEHDANAKLEEIRETFADLKVKGDDSDPRDQKRERVTDAPHSADQ